MKFDDVPARWQAANSQSLSPQQREDQIARVCRKAERLGSKILFRDMIETIVAVLVAVNFGWMFFKFEQPVARIGAATITLGSLFIIYKLNRTRMGRKPSHLNASVRDYCRSEMERLDRQIGLLTSVWWWYLTPIIAGANLITVGKNGICLFSIVYGAATVVLGWFLYWLNQQAVRNTLLPQRNELNGLLEELSQADEAQDSTS